MGFILVQLCCLSQWEMGSLVCVQGSVHMPTHHWGLLFYIVKENIPLQSYRNRSGTSTNTHKYQIESSVALHFILFAAVSVLDACALEIKSDNNLKHFFLC